MSTASLDHRTTAYRPALAWFAALGSAWVFVLVTLGAFTTTIGAGMAFQDWPLSNGSVNPEGWLNDIMMFAEHSHRLTGMIMGFITIGLAIWVSRTDERAWVRRLAWWALAIVIIQGVIGGKRVLLDSIAVPGFEMTLGQMLRIPHGILAHLYVCMLFAIAAALSRRWIESKPQVEPTEPRLRQFARLATTLVVVQLIIAASMRHNYAGMALPAFPHSTLDGHWLPAHWDYRVGLAFAHRIMAVILTFVLGWLVAAVWRDRASTIGLKNLSVAIIVLLLLQISLGASVIWTGRDPHYTTAHVTIGACVLATTFLLTWWLHRGVIEGEVETKFGEPTRSAVQALRS
jgi:cytochrome c oxidase assembly protein subunit 15